MAAPGSCRWTGIADRWGAQPEGVPTVWLPELDLKPDHEPTGPSPLASAQKRADPT